MTPAGRPHQGSGTQQRPPTWLSAYVQTLRALVDSVAARRTLSLPNVLRLLCRKMAALDKPPSSAQREIACRAMTALYMKHQPFERIAARRRRRRRPGESR